MNPGVLAGSPDQIVRASMPMQRCSLCIVYLPKWECDGEVVYFRTFWQECVTYHIIVYVMVLSAQVVHCYVLVIVGSLLLHVAVSLVLLLDLNQLPVLLVKGYELPSFDICLVSCRLFASDIALGVCFVCVIDMYCRVLGHGGLILPVMLVCGGQATFTGLVCTMRA